jgi:2-methylcitrate dehydratase PrpD
MYPRSHGENTLTETVTSQLTHYAAATSYRAIPEPVRELAKKIIFDELACAYFGRRSAAGALTARYAASAGGDGEARIYGTGLRAPAAYAALANGTAGHGEEVDGAHVVGGHPGASIVHAAMAICEQQRTTGADLINAVVLAYDVGVRIVQACGGKFSVRDTRHLTSDFFYAFGCATAASRVLGLDATRHAHALALVSFQTNGLYALYSEQRHISKSFCNGQFAFAGISAALMAATGLEGNEDILGAPDGVLDAWGKEGGGDLLVQGLGTDFAITGANFKFFNAGYPIHTPVEAVMGLIRDHQIDHGAIQSIRIGMPEGALRTVDNRHMHNICVQDMVAASIVSGGLQLRDLPFPTILSSAEFQRIRAAIVTEVDPDIQRVHPIGRGARVTISARGETFSRQVDHPRGHSLRGEVTWDDLAEKWRGSLGGCDLALALTIAQGLDELDDINVLASAFTGIME